MTPQALRQKIKGFESTPPITLSLESALTKQGTWSAEGVWYRSQQEHWLGWLSEYDGPGAYGRKTSVVRSAEFAYNHVVWRPCRPRWMTSHATSVCIFDHCSRHRMRQVAQPLRQIALRAIR